MQKAIELDNKFHPGIGLNVNNQQHIDWMIEALEDPRISIDYIGMNIADMQKYIGRELEEALNGEKNSDK